MRIPWLVKELIPRQFADPRPPLPAEPLYAWEARGDAPPMPPSSDRSEGLDEPAPPRPAPRAPSLAVGSVVRERPRGDASTVTPSADDLRALLADVAAELVPNPLMNAVAAEPPTRSTRQAGWSLRTQPFGLSYPSRIYAIRDITGLRWERLNGRGMWVLHYDEGVVAEELPAWIPFGPRGEQVAEILEAVAHLSPEQVRALPVAADLPKFGMSIEMLPDPTDSPFRDAARLASSTAMLWTESRGWACDPDAGGHYYSGCYFVYNLSEPHWLSAMGRAMNAAIAGVLGPELPGSVATRVHREWMELAA